MPVQSRPTRPIRRDDSEAGAVPAAGGARAEDAVLHPREPVTRNRHRRGKEGVMRKAVAFLAAMFLVLGTAYGQERAPGAGRIEIGAFPGGGIFFGNDATNDGPNFGNYALGASMTVNFNKWVGVEGEVGGGIGIRQNMTFN